MTNCWNAKAHPALLKSSGEAPLRNNTVAASGTTNTLNPVNGNGVRVRVGVRVGVRVRVGVGVGVRVRVGVGVGVIGRQEWNIKVGNRKTVR